MHIFTTLTGWAIWVVSALIAIASATMYYWITHDDRFNQDGPRSALLIFALLIAASLIATISLNVSKFHLVWALPAALVVAALADKRARIVLAWHVGRLVKSKASQQEPTTQQGSGLKVQYIDLRSSEEVRLADESAQGINVPDGSDELVRLIREAHYWGKSNEWPLYAQYPQYERIRAIGQRLHKNGGLHMMQRAGYYVREQYPDFGYMIEHFWDGIGDWIA